MGVALALPSILDWLRDLTVPCRDEYSERTGVTPALMAFELSSGGVDLVTTEVQSESALFSGLIAPI